MCSLKRKMLSYLGLFAMLNYMRIRNDAKLPLGYICMAACYYFKCYGVQAHSAHHTIGQQIQEMSCWGKEYNFIQRDGWQGRWQTQSHHLVGGLDVRFFYGSEMERGEETK